MDLYFFRRIYFWRVHFLGRWLYLLKDLMMLSHFLVIHYSLINFSAFILIVISLSNSCKNRKISPEEVDEDGTVAGLFYLITLSRLNSEDHKDNFWHLSRFLDFFVTFRILSYSHSISLDPKPEEAICESFILSCRSLSKIILIA